MNKRLGLFMLVLICSIIFHSNAFAYTYPNPDYIPSREMPDNLGEAVSESNKFINYKYFPEDSNDRTNINNDTLRALFYYDKTLMLTYGQPHDYDKSTGKYRYIGYNKSGEDMTNVEFRDDADFKGKLEEKNWIITPWESTDSHFISYKKSKSIKVLSNYFDGRPILHNSIIEGLKTARPGNFTEGKTENFNWTQYVHVLQPPTYYGWGVGRLWHKKVDDSIWYITVPLAPIIKQSKIAPNFKVHDLIPGTGMQTMVGTNGRTIYLAKPGETYTATVKFSVDSLEGIYITEIAPIFIYGGKTDKVPVRANLSKVIGDGLISSPISSADYEYPFKELQSIKFNCEDSTIEARFNWQATADTRSVVAAINFNPALKMHYEGVTAKEYLDNFAIVPVDVIPDTYAHISLPNHTPADNKTLQGKVTFGSSASVNYNVEALVTLRIDGKEYKPIYGTKITLKPGGTEEFDFNYSGINKNYEIEALIRNLSPITDDSNEKNNLDRVWVNKATKDIAAVGMQQRTSVKASTSQLTTVTWKNQGNQPVQDVPLRYYVGGQQVKSETHDFRKGEIYISSFNWTAPTGDTTVKGQAIINDDNDDNNQISRQVDVKANVVESAHCSEENPTESWTETYWYIDGYRVKERVVPYIDPATGEVEDRTEYYTDTNDPIWDSKNVTYSESLTTTVKLNTKQGIATDPKHPKESDRESRGSWEIIPWATDKGLDPNLVTRAGYGFEMEVTTNYRTDYEDKVPAGAQAHGGTLKGPQKVTIEFIDTKGKRVDLVELEPVSGSRGQDTIKWAIPEVRIKDSNGKYYWERKHYIDPKTPDGQYYAIVHIDGVGKNNLWVCNEKNYVTVYGSMYDDVYTRPK